MLPFSNSPTFVEVEDCHKCLHHQRKRSNIQWTAFHSDFRKWTTCSRAAPAPNGGFLRTWKLEARFTVVCRTRD